MEVAETWGARIEAVVQGRAADPWLKQRFQYLTRIDHITAHSLEPYEPWSGVAFATVKDKHTSWLVQYVCSSWQPLIVILAYPGSIKQKELLKQLPTLGDHYHKRLLKPRHIALGGVSRSIWHLVHFTRDTDLGRLDKALLMTAPTYQRTLQTVLDDTIASVDRYVFEEQRLSEESVAGFIMIKPVKTPVYDATGWAPDLSELHYKERDIWVLTESVWSKEQVVRQIVGL